jgi:hypothetical protein
MPQYVEVDDAGEFVLNADGEKNVMDVPPSSWESVKAEIPEEFKDEKMWENVPDTQTLLKNYAHAQKRMGSAVSIPGEGATDEERAEFLSKLGRPESPSEYGVEFPELPEGTMWDEEAQDGFLNAAHKAGLNADQVKGILGWYGEYSKDVDMKGERGIREVSDTLRKDWGERFDSNIALTQKAVAKLGGLELQTVLDTTGLGNHPDLIRAFFRAGKMMEEHNYIAGEVQGITNRDAAKSEIAQIFSDANHPYHHGMAHDPRPIDQSAQEHMRKLHELAYGE